jgi:hypothetical protein
MEILLLTFEVQHHVVPRYPKVMRMTFFACTEASQVMRCAGHNVGIRLWPVA